MSIEPFNLTSIKQVQQILAERGIRPQKKFGQNFLIDRNILNIITSLAGLHRQDTVLEIGPGLGGLTERLLLHCNNVIAIEIDHQLAAFLRDQLPQLNVVEADALEYDIQLLPPNYKLIANLPYSTGNRILMRLIASPNPPQSAVIMTQRDVAERLQAQPNEKDYGILTIFTQLLYTVKIEKDVSPSCFYPAPQIWSSLVSFTPRADEPEIDRPYFLQVIKWAFAHRRKQLGTIFKNRPDFLPTTIDPTEVFARLGIDPRARPENLDVATWVKLAKELQSADAHEENF